MTRYSIRKYWSKVLQPARPLLMATSAFRLGRRRQSLPQRYYLHPLRFSVKMHQKSLGSRAPPLSAGGASSPPPVICLETGTGDGRKRKRYRRDGMGEKIVTVVNFKSWRLSLTTRVESITTSRLIPPSSFSFLNTCPARNIVCTLHCF